MLYPDSVAEFVFDCIEAGLRDICPYAQNVREICNFDHANLTFLELV